MNETAPPGSEFDANALAKHLLRTIRAGALASLHRDGGFPFASLVTVATDMDGSPLLLMSRLSVHTLNLERDPRASVLLAEAGKGDPLAHPRLTVIGRAERTTEPRVRARFLARHPKAKRYADFADFSFWRLHVASAHLNGGFARAMGIAAPDLMIDLSDAADLLAGEESILQSLNGEDRAVLALCGAAISGTRAQWRATGLDPEGLDLAAGDITTRVPFSQTVRSRQDLFRELEGMVERARSGAANVL